VIVAIIGASTIDGLMERGRALGGFSWMDWKGTSTLLQDRGRPIG
jgi:hypothetical protein